VALVVSGLTAFPIESQLRFASAQFPFIAYGTDWLAFAHLVIAVAFVGPLREPVKNIWVIEFGIISAIAVVPMAFIAGEVRSIPVFWRLLDCLFGIIGALVLWRCHADIKHLERTER
jgi:hypothetical protein